MCVCIYIYIYINTHILIASGLPQKDLKVGPSLCQRSLGHKIGHQPFKSWS